MWNYVRRRVVWLVQQMRQLPVISVLLGVGGVLLLISREKDMWLCLLVIIGMTILLRYLHQVSWLGVCGGGLIGVVALGQGLHFWESPENLNSYVNGSYSARVIEVVEYRAASSRYVIQLLSEQKPLAKVVVDSVPFPRYVAGDVLQVACQPEQIVDKSSLYWRQKNVWYRCSRAVMYENPLQAVTVPQSPWWNLIRLINRGVLDSWSQIQKVFSYPYADFLVSMTIGLPISLNEYDDALRAAGLSHTVSVSGYNLTIVVSSMLVLFPVHWRKARFGVMLTSLVGFVVGAGFSSPVLRAAGMIGWQRVGAILQRSSSVYNAIAWSVVFSLLIAPSELYSLSLYLSTAALLGIVLISPVLSGWLQVALVKLHIRVRSLPVVSPRWREEHFYPATVKPQKIVQYAAWWQEINSVAWYRIPAYNASGAKALKLTGSLSWCKPWGTLRTVGQEILIPTTAATITTFGLIIAVFQSTTVWFLVGNLLCLWVVPIITIVGLGLLGIGALCSVWNGLVGVLFLGLPVIVPLLEYFIVVIRKIQSFPGTALELVLPPWAIVVGYLGVVLFVLLTYPFPHND